MINHYLTLLVDELRADDIPDPLGQPFTLAAIWDDLARLAGETPPAVVRFMLDDRGPLWDGAPAVASRSITEAAS